jgi:hypothetical protein
MSWEHYSIDSLFYLFIYTDTKPILVIKVNITSEWSQTFINTCLLCASAIPWGFDGIGDEFEFQLHTALP